MSSLLLLFSLHSSLQFYILPLFFFINLFILLYFFFFLLQLLLKIFISFLTMSFNFISCLKWIGWSSVYGRVAEKISGSRSFRRNTKSRYEKQKWSLDDRVFKHTAVDKAFIHVLWPFSFCLILEVFKLHWLHFNFHKTFRIENLGINRTF